VTDASAYSSLSRDVSRRPVMVLGDTSNTALSVIRALTSLDCPVYGIDVSGGRSFCFWSKYLAGHFRVTAGDGEALLAHASTLRARHGASCILFPTTERAALLADSMKAKLWKEGHTVFLSPHRPYKELIDKRSMFQLAERAGFRVPATRIGLDAQSVREIGYPVIIKTLDSLEGKRYTILRCNADLESLNIGVYEDLRTLIVQAFIEGQEEYVVSACRLANGQTIVGTVARKLESWPRGRGEATAIESQWLDGLEQIVKALLDASDWYGIADIDLIRDRTSGEIYFLEVNYRVGAGVYLGVLGGTNLPQLMVAESLGIPAVAPPRIRDEIVLVQDALAVGHLRSTGLAGLTAYLRLLRRADGYTIFDRVDWVPFAVLWLRRFAMSLQKLFDPRSYLRKLRKVLKRRYLIRSGRAS